MVAITEFIGPWQGGSTPGQVEGECVVSLGDRQVDGERLIDDAVGIDPGGALVGAVGQLLDLGAHLPGGGFAQLLDGGLDGLGTVAIEQRGEPPGTDLERGSLGLDVADPLLGDADVGHDDGVDLGVHPAALEELDRRQAQPLLLDLGGTRREAAGDGTADVGPVAGVGEPAPVPALVEEGLDEADIHQMCAAEIGVVDDVDVVGLGRCRLAGSDLVDHRLGTVLHGADEDRQAQLALGDQRPVGQGVNAIRAVVGLGDHRREGGA